MAKKSGKGVISCDADIEARIQALETSIAEKPIQQ